MNDQRGGGFIDGLLKFSAALMMLILCMALIYFVAVFLQKVMKEERVYSARQEGVPEQQMVTPDEPRKSDPLTRCLLKAEADYVKRWDRTCWNLGAQSDCPLPMSVAKHYDDDHELKRKECFLKYPPILNAPFP